MNALKAIDIIEGRKPLYGEAAEYIITILGKEIPKEPLDISSEYDGDYGYCPFCGGIINDYDNNYRCNRCGQLLCWK